MKTHLKFLLLTLAASVLAGCATPDWATNNEWRKKTGWEVERVQGIWLIPPSEFSH